jgi:hypothetical protein
MFPIESLQVRHNPRAFYWLGTAPKTNVSWLVWLVVSVAPDRWIWWTTTGCLALLALIAGTVSYLHMHLLVELHGQPGWVAVLTPFSVDGMIVAASTTLLGRFPFRWPRRDLALGHGSRRNEWPCCRRPPARFGHHGSERWGPGSRGWLVRRRDFDVEISGRSYFSVVGICRAGAGRAGPCC